MPVTVPQKTSYTQGEGSPSAFLSGTGRAVPTGIEAMLEYNGLLLNAQDNLDAYVVTQIDIERSIRDAETELPNDHGSAPMTPLYGPTTLSVQGYIRSSRWEKLRDMQEALDAAFVDLRLRDLIFRNNPSIRDFYITCRKVGTIMPSDMQVDGRVRRGFTIPLKAYNPRILSVLQQSRSTAITTAKHSLIMVNEGIFEAQPKIEVYGAVENLRITNTTTGQQMGINGFVPAGERYVFDIAGKTMQDKNGNNVFDKLWDQSDWMTLASGEQTIEITSTNRLTGAMIGFSWRDTWI